MQDFKSAHPPLDWLLQTAPHLKPRQFSIASSQRMHPGQAHIAVAVVDYKTPFKRRKMGLCSSWLASIRPAHESGAASSNVEAMSDVSEETAVATGSNPASRPTSAVPGTSLSYRTASADAGSHSMLPNPSSSSNSQPSGICTSPMNISHNIPQHPDQPAESATTHSKHQLQHASEQHGSVNGLHSTGNALPPTATQPCTSPTPQHQSVGSSCLVPVWVDKGILHLPHSHQVPLILVGPGTGIAPFRAFLEERAALASQGTHHQKPA